MSDLATSARELLGGWEPPAGPAREEQRALRTRYLDVLDGARAVPGGGCTREAYPDHLTAGVLVLSADRRQVLLNLHGKARRWFAFGGHCEPADPTLRDAARREGVEESGLGPGDLALTPLPLQLDVHTVEFCDPRGTVSHLDVRYAALARPGSRARVSEESLALRWFDVAALDEVDPPLEASMRALVDLARAADYPAWSDADVTSSGAAPTWSSGGGAISAAADQPSR